MKTRLGVIALLLIVFGTGFQGCRSTLALLTKNAKRTVINEHNQRYDLVVKLNYSTGNPQPTFVLDPEHVEIVNGKLTTVIKDLSGHPSTRVVYLNKHHRRKMKLDITYNYKAPFTNRAPYDTLLLKLSERLDIKVVNDSVANITR